MDIKYNFVEYKTVVLLQNCQWQRQWKASHWRSSILKK